MKNLIHIIFVFIIVCINIKCSTARGGRISRRIGGLFKWFKASKSHKKWCKSIHDEFGCHHADGCVWKAGKKILKCKSNGLSSYFADRNMKCGQIKGLRDCKSTRTCSWSRASSTCRVSKLLAAFEIGRVDKHLISLTTKLEVTYEWTQNSNVGYSSVNAHLSPQPQNVPSYGHTSPKPFHVSAYGSQPPIVAYPPVSSNPTQSGIDFTQTFDNDPYIGFGSGTSRPAGNGNWLGGNGFDQNVQSFGAHTTSYGHNNDFSSSSLF